MLDKTFSRTYFEDFYSFSIKYCIFCPGNFFRKTSSNLSSADFAQSVLKAKCYQITTRDSNFILILESNLFI